MNDFPVEFHPGLGVRPAVRDGSHDDYSWTIGEDGLRITIGSHVENLSVISSGVIWLGGTSAAWGVGVNDWETIASQIAKRKGLVVRNAACGGHMPHQEMLYISSLLSRLTPPNVLAVYSGGNAVRYGASATIISPSLRLKEPGIPAKHSRESLVQSLSIPIFRHGGLSLRPEETFDFRKMIRFLGSYAVAKFCKGPTHLRARLLEDAPLMEWPYVSRVCLKNEPDWVLASEMAYLETYLQLSHLKCLKHFYGFRVVYFLQPLQSLAVGAPKFEKHTHNHPPRDVWDEYGRRLEDACQSQNIEFYDLSRDIPFAGNFRDSIHLTAQGAKLIAEKIVSVIDS